MHTARTTLEPLTAAGAEALQLRASVNAANRSSVRVQEN